MMFSVCFSSGARTATTCAPHVEFNPEWQNATFRPHTSSVSDCPVDEDTYQKVINNWFADGKDAGTELKSFFLGRAIHYPWISEHIARAALRPSSSE